MKRWMVISLSLVVLASVAVLLVVHYVRSTSSWIQSVEWSEPDLGSVADGVYTGTASLKMPPGTAAANTTATVRVTVQNHRYVAIEVTAPPPIVKRMTEYAQIVVQNQSVRPDAISGGTVTKSLVLMAAARAAESRQHEE